MAEAADWRNRREWERFAWLAGMGFSAAGKRSPSMKRMLAFLPGELSGKSSDIHSPEQAAEFVESLAREHKKRAWTMLKDKFAEPENKE